MCRVAITKIVLVVEYDGSGYYGFQLQVGQPTIQGELEAALMKLTGESMRVIAASRTDAGVHAEGQVVSLRTRSPLPVKAFVMGLDYYLPDDIAVKVAFRADNAFDVRRDAVSREYNYYILNRQTRSPMKRKFMHHVTGRLDIGVMNEACQALTGERDCASFATGDEDVGTKNTVRSVYKAEVERNGDSVVFHIVAGSFLRHQVRNTVGSLIRVGLGKMTLADFRNMVEAKEPGLAGPTAPACGLCLMRVNYPQPLGEDTWGDV